jgi:hypothetical protein
MNWFFCSVPTYSANDEDGKNPHEKEWRRFPFADKTDLKDLVWAR